MALERAVEPVAAAPQAALPLAELTRPRLGDRAAALAADSLDRQVVGVLALVRELHDRRSVLELGSGEREVELARLDEETCRCCRGDVAGDQGDRERGEQRGALHRTTFGRATLAPAPSTLA